jgi:hypothetical protein
VTSLDSRPPSSEAVEALRESARLHQLACDHFEQGDRELAQEAKRAAEMKDDEALRLLKSLP